MRRYILLAIAACLYYSGVVGFARKWARRDGGRLIILNYHQASGGDLRRHLEYLKYHYRLQHVEAALEELYSRRKGQRQPGDRRTALVLTFDDGYQDNYTHAFPLAQELQIPFTIYLIPGYIESGTPFWWLEKKWLLQRTHIREVMLEGRRYVLRRREDRRELARLIDTRVRYACSVAKRERFLVELRRCLQVPLLEVQKEDASRPLTWEQVHEMEQSGLVSFGAHTLSHPVLSALAEPLEVETELIRCRTMLEQQLRYCVRTLAYPVGQWQHIRAEVREAAQRTGYSWALTTHYGFNTAKSDPYLLRRIEVDVSQHWLVVAAEAAGVWGFFARLRWFSSIRQHFTNASYSD